MTSLSTATYICPECNADHAVELTAEFEELERSACATLSASSNEVYSRSGLGQGGRWEFAEGETVIRFVFPNEQIRQANFQFLGTWAPAPQSFRWGWDHPYANDGNRLAADVVLEVGEKKEFDLLRNNLVGCDEHQSWHLAHIAGFLSDFKCIYRMMVSDKAWMYVAFNELELVKQ